MNKKSARSGLIRLRQIRESKGMTQEALAHEAGISTALVSGYETGNRRWTKKSLEPVAKALEVPVADLIGREDADGVNMVEAVEVLREKVDADYIESDKTELNSLLEIVYQKISRARQRRKEASPVPPDSN